MRYMLFSDNTLPLHINSVGCSSDSAVTRFGPGRRDQYIIHYVTSGQGFYNGNTVKAGQGFLIYPHQLEEYYPDKNNPWDFLWIISYDNAMENIFKRYNANPKTLIFDYNSVLTVKRAENKIREKNNTVVDSAEILEMFLHILNSHIKSTVFHKSSSQVYIDFCLDYIETNLHTEITVQQLTELLGISQPYLYKIFKKYFNLSAKQFILKRKTEQAKKLLIETNLTVTQIANSLGYNSVLDFSKMFKHQAGVSPLNFRTSEKA